VTFAACIRDHATFCAWAEALELLSEAEREAVASVGCVAVGEHLRGAFLSDRNLVVIREGCAVAEPLHELLHAARGDEHSTADNEAAVAMRVRELGGTGLAADASRLAPGFKAPLFTTHAGTDTVWLTHECGRRPRTFAPTLRHRPARIVAACEACGESGTVGLTTTCTRCGADVRMTWGADATPGHPVTVATCCGVSVARMLEKGEPSEPPGPARVYADRARGALTQAARQLRRVAQGEVHPDTIGAATLGHVLLAARHLSDEDREHVASVVRDVRALIDSGEVMQAAAALEKSARELG
jgi:hypothetical protein